MNADDANELKELEGELSRMLPRQPGEFLEARVEGELRSGAPERVGKWWYAVVLAGLGVMAASVVVLFQLHGPRVASSVSRETQVRPAWFLDAAAARTQLVRETYGQPVQLKEGLVRPVRRVYVDRLVWRDSASKTQVEWLAPRDEIQVELINLL